MYVRLPTDLTKPEDCATLGAGAVTVETLIDLAERSQAACKANRDRLKAIEALQPPAQ